MVDYENLATSNAPFFEEIEAAVSRVVRSGRYILGPEVTSFESEFSAYVGAKHCLGVASGLDALILALEALELPEGSEVIVASNSYIATIMAILHAGLTPKLVEPVLETYNLDPSRLPDALTSRTSAILVTHMFGKPCLMHEINGFAQQHGLTVIEDCAQSHGAMYKGGMTGTFGDLGCFSFYPTKNLGGAGDGGAIVTNNSGLADRITHLRNYGSKIKYHNEFLGRNSRLDDLQAGILRVKLKYIDSIISHKRSIAATYFEELPNWLTLPSRHQNEFDVFHIFPVRVERGRDHFREWLFEEGVNTEIHYPIPPHRQKSMKEILRGDWPIAEKLHNSELSLPISFGTSMDQVNFVIDKIKKYKPL